MLIVAICILGISLSVYLAYTCEEIKNRKGKIALGIITGILLISSATTLLFSAGNAAAEEKALTKDIVIIYVLTALVLLGLRGKTKRLQKYRKAQNIIKLQEDV